MEVDPIPFQYKGVAADPQFITINADQRVFEKHSGWKLTENGRQIVSPSSLRKKEDVIDWIDKYKADSLTANCDQAQAVVIQRNVGRSVIIGIKIGVISPLNASVGVIPASMTNEINVHFSNIGSPVRATPECQKIIDSLKFTVS